MKEPINKIYTECKQKGWLVTQLQGQSQGLGLCRELNQTSGQEIPSLCLFLIVQGLLHTLGTLMDPNSSLFLFPGVGFQLDCEQSHSTHIAILLVLMWRRGQDLSQSQPRMILAHLDLRNTSGHISLCTAAVGALTSTPGIYPASTPLCQHSLWILTINPSQRLKNLLVFCFFLNFFKFFLFFKLRQLPMQCCRWWLLRKDSRKEGKVEGRKKGLGALGCVSWSQPFLQCENHIQRG